MVGNQFSPLGLGDIVVPVFFYNGLLMGTLPPSFPN